MAHCYSLSPNPWLIASALLLTCMPAHAGPPVPVLPQAPPSASTRKTSTDLDAFMERVLQRRDESWKKLHDYILSETETFSIAGPGQLPLSGFHREFTWYVRDGYLVRSPVRFDGVVIAEADRRKYEEQWLAEEKRREAKAQKGQTTGAPSAPSRSSSLSSDASPTEALMSQRGEPRFISEAYFLQFKFEPGNYYLAGRERLADREVLKVEYYPSRLFTDNETEREHPSKAGEKASRPKTTKAPTTDADDEDIERKLNKIALVTLWIDPAEYQNRQVHLRQHGVWVSPRPMACAYR